MFYLRGQNQKNPNYAQTQIRSIYNLMFTVLCQYILTQVYFSKVYEDFSKVINCNKWTFSLVNLCWTNLKTKLQSEYGNYFLPSGHRSLHFPTYTLQPYIFPKYFQCYFQRSYKLSEKEPTLEKKWYLGLVSKILINWFIN